MPIAATAAGKVKLKPTRAKIIKGAVPNQGLDWPICWDAVWLIADIEKLTLEPYVCPAGVPTNGWGETDGVYMGMPAWTKEYADQRFLDSLRHFSADVQAACLPTVLNANQLGAATSLAYNIGLGAFRTSSVAKAIRRGDLDSAARSFGLWNKFTPPGAKAPVESSGLTARRAKERAMFLSPIPEVDGEHPAGPQEVSGESTMAKSPMMGSAVTTVGTGALGLITAAGDKAEVAGTAVTKVTTATTGVRGFLAQFDVTPLEAFGAIALIAGAVVAYWRWKQRQQGWA